MRAGLRWKTAYVAMGLLLAAAPALAQTVPDTSSNTPASDAIGPRELQNFSLPGTRTTPAEQQSAPSSSAPRAPSEAKPRSQAPVTAVREAAREPARAATGQKSADAPALSQGPVAAPEQKAAAAPPPPAVSLDSRQAARSFGSTPLPSADTTPVAVAPKHRMPVVPWIIAALLVALGAIFLLWRRNRQREAFAGGPQYDFLAPPEPAPAATPAPPAPRVASPARLPEPPPAPAAGRSPAPSAGPVPRPSGIVASRLRPSIELAMQPLRCLVDDEEVTIEFEVELFNSGAAPARAVIAEASLFNASSSQEQELAAFYARPPGAGDRIDSIPPMRRMTFTNRVVAPRAQVQEYELAGRKSFVPVLAFNARYEWSGGKGQSSLAYLLGRETRGDKLGPLHLDGAQRELRGLGARVLPTAVRT